MKTNVPNVEFVVQFGTLCSCVLLAENQEITLMYYVEDNLFYFQLVCVIPVS